MSEKRNIIGFKKFSDMNSGKKKIEEVELNGSTEEKIPMNPNLPDKTKKVEAPASTKNLMPCASATASNSEEDSNAALENLSENNIQKIGKIAKFPKNVKASKAYNFLENVKISKKSIWYIMVEKNNELQMVKYNYNEGVDLAKFVNELKTYYLSKNHENKAVCEAINNITIDGNDKFSMIKNIPPIEIEGKKIISKITEDLIKLLSR